MGFDVGRGCRVWNPALILPLRRLPSAASEDFLIELTLSAVLAFGPWVVSHAGTGVNFRVPRGLSVFALHRAGPLMENSLAMGGIGVPTSMDPVMVSRVVRLCVGGRKFTTSIETLTKVCPNTAGLFHNMNWQCKGR